MPATLEFKAGRGELLREADGWIVCREPQAEIPADVKQLLSQAPARRPGNTRYVIDCGQACLLGELRDVDGLLTLAEAEQRLLNANPELGGGVSNNEVGCALHETGYAWSQPEDDPQRWEAVAKDPRGGSCALVASVVPGGVEVCGQLASWDADCLDAGQEALVRFLTAAQGRVRFARFVLAEDAVNAVSFAAADRLDFELPDSVGAVVAACRLVWREVRALAHQEVAQAYLAATD